MTSRHLPLHDGWTLGADGPVPVGLPAGGVPAAVPGCVHTDLLAAGLIDDPYLDDNENRLGWIGRTDWTYRTTFDWSDDGHAFTDLCFDGLDTVATVLLNGTEVGSTANQHRSYRFPVRPLLREGPNTLVVRFTAPYTYAEALRDKLGDRPGAYTEPYAFIRKMACNFGWDWGPTLVTSGIWRPVALESRTGPRLAGVKVVGDLDGDGVPRLTVTLDVDRAGSAALSGSVEVVGACAVFVADENENENEDRDAHRVTVTLSVPQAATWWPHSHGEQPLYDVTVRLGEEVAWIGRTGFRGVTLEREAFRISVNDEPVFVRGVNWIPDDCFPARITRQRISDRLDQALAAGVNLVRVWGGGLYESDDFYELCDEKGLLVWQDFPFACAAYPEEQPLYDEVAAEVRENLVRLAPHPSLVLWCGNNENLEGHADWGWQEKLEGRTWGHGYYHELLPALCAETDPSRPYWPGSPYSGSPELPPQDPSRGTVHLWDVWNRVDYRHYADTAHRFVAEFGFQGPPAYATLRRAVSGPLAPGSPLLAHHQKAEDGDAKLLRGLGDHLPRPDGSSFDDWHWLTQLNQARAVAFGIRHFRSHSPYCTGSIVWQLNDCWPVVSWAAVDGDGRRKPLWYALRQVYADRLMAVRDGALHLVNDSARLWEGALRLTRRSLDGTVLAEETVAVGTAARGVTRVPLPPSVAEPDDSTREVLVAELGEQRVVEFYEEDTRVALPPARYRATVTQGDESGIGYRVTVTALTLLRDLALFPDRLDPAAEVDDMLVTLLPGESAVLHVTGAVLEEPEALLSRPVLRCVNDTVED
ncbi:glycoside hydrolase family 2 protein [Streptomyces sp. ME01-18a]|uniref:glycoside hydrolase family 2 protein n=1 Tax=Streptomyces sp. ME01-18a TaxID=3028669 RepID=UPI0029BE0EF7|nr:glycoside hydrolase family 2 protein [Streptomyces sp. ME01-18a]MDX3433179.1 glycoside hydrolase family 2 protein [Streptomyces sp. ME01-18a]